MKITNLTKIDAKGEGDTHIFNPRRPDGTKAHIEIDSGETIEVLGEDCKLLKEQYEYVLKRLIDDNILKIDEYDKC